MRVSSNNISKQFRSPLGCGTRECALAHAGGISVGMDVQLTGDGPSTENLFTITDSVRILGIYFIITAVGNSTTFSNVQFEIDDGGSQTDITDTVDCSGTVVGALAYKALQNTSALALVDADTVNLNDTATRTVNHEFVVVQKTGDAASYIRLSYTGDGSTDVTIHAVARYQPLATTSSVDPV